MKGFKAYDIRGIYNKDFNKDDAYKIGFFLPKLLKTNKILVGRDARLSSPEIYKYLTKGITDSGADVYDAGLCTTPIIYYGTAHDNFDASVMITASHNPAEYNGMKISKTNALPVGYDSGLSDLEAMLNNDITIADKKGEIHDIDLKTNYLKFLKSYMPSTSELNIVFDCSNGMASLFVKEIFGDKPQYLFDEIDGSFPNHEPNPLVESNLVALKQKVKETNADVGVIYDGDADRVMFVDENGQFVSPDLMIALLGQYFLVEKKQKAKVLQDIRTSKAVKTYIENLGGEMHMWRVGRAYAALKLREIDGLFGGELAGHYYFKDFYYSDSGLLASIIFIRILEAQKAKGKSFSELINEIRKYENSGEINFKIEDKQQAMDEVKKYFDQNEKIEAFYDFDGYRIEFKEWWLSIRPSNTEPYLRLLVEATNSELLNEKVEKIKSILSNFS